MGRTRRIISLLVPVVVLAAAAVVAAGGARAPQPRPQGPAQRAVAISGDTEVGVDGEWTEAGPDQRNEAEGVEAEAAREAEEAEREGSVHTPIDPDAVVSLDTPSATTTALPDRAITEAAIRRAVAQRAPGDLLLTKSADLGAGKGSGKASLVAEPSVARYGSNVLATWNWYAARSTDGGNTFTFMNPAKKFAKAYGGFCCDQLVTYVPSRDLWIWVMQYDPNAAGNNALRLAVTDSAGLAAGDFSANVMINPQRSLKLPNGINLDQPDMAFSDNYLYIEAEVYKGVRYTGVSEIMRFDLADLAALTPGAGLGFVHRKVPVFSPGLTTGATDTMYIAGHTDNDTLHLYAWPESLPGPSLMPEWSIDHAAYPQVLPYQCPALYGTSKTNWCKRSDDRINTGWLANGRIGFAWNASQGSGGMGLFPYPYVHVLELDATTKAVLGEPVVWNSNSAWQYAALTANSAGDLGGVGMAGGGGFYPACATLVRDNYTAGAWGADWYFNSDAYTGRPVAGDYQSSYPNAGNGATWSAGCSFIDDGAGNHDGKGDNTDVHPVFMSFGREDDSPA